MNQYPVLFVSFKDVEELNFEETRVSPQTTFAKLYKNHANLAEKGLKKVFLWYNQTLMWL